VGARIVKRKRRVTPAQERRIEDLRIEGLSLRVIAETTGVPETTVRYTLYRLAREAEGDKHDQRWYAPYKR